MKRETRIQRQIEADEASVKGLTKLTKKLRGRILSGRYRVRKADLQCAGNNDAIEEGSIDNLTQLATLANSEQEQVIT